MTRYYVVRRVGSLPSCYRWYGFDAEDGTRGPLTGSRRTKAEITKDLVDSGATVISEAQVAHLPLYVKMRETGTLTLTREEEAGLSALRGIAKTEGLTLVQRRSKNPWSRRSLGPLSVAAVIPGTQIIARFDRGMRDVQPAGDFL